LRQENEGVVEEFMVRNPEFKLVEVNGLLDKWNNGFVTAGSFFKLLPHIHGTDGFFCAVLEKHGVY
jgi:16S rRNA (cytosine967-C5)-methyltransferase